VVVLIGLVFVLMCVVVNDVVWWGVYMIVFLDDVDLFE